MSDHFTICEVGAMKETVCIISAVFN